MTAAPSGRRCPPGAVYAVDVVECPDAAPRRSLCRLLDRVAVVDDLDHARASSTARPTSPR